MSNSFIQPIEGTLLGATTPGGVDVRAMAMRDFFAFPKTPAFLKTQRLII